MALDDSALQPSQLGSIAPPPAPRRASPTLGPKGSVIARDSIAPLSPADELGRRGDEDDAEDDIVAADDDEADREALESKRYGDVAGDPYASLGDAFGD